MILTNLTFCSTPRFDDPQNKPYDFPKTALWQNARFPRVLPDGPIRRSWKTLCCVAFFSLVIPRVTPKIFRRWRFSKYTFSYGFARCPFWVILKNPTFCRTPRFGDLWTNPTILWKQRFGKIHIFLGFCTMPILMILKNPTFCSTPRLDDPQNNPYDFPKAALWQNARFARVLHDAQFWWSWKPWFL